LTKNEVNNESTNEKGGMLEVREVKESEKGKKEREIGCAGIRGGRE
jgi:hypothetical protein